MRADADDVHCDSLAGAELSVPASDPGVPNSAAVGSMSAGQKRRVSIAAVKTLMKKPAFVGGIVVLAALIPSMESYLHGAII